MLIDDEEEEDKASDKEMLTIDRVMQETNENKEKGKDISYLSIEEVDGMPCEIDQNSTNRSNLNEDAKDLTRTCDDGNFRSIVMESGTMEEENKHQATPKIKDELKIKTAEDYCV